MASFRKTLNIPFGVSHPIWLLNLGAKLIGTETELVLKSRNVKPKRLLDSGFKFYYHNIDLALLNLLKKD